MNDAGSQKTSISGFVILSAVLFTSFLAATGFRSSTPSASASIDTHSQKVLARLTEDQRIIHEYMVRRADAITERAAGEIHSKDSWEAVRKERSEELRDMMGLLPWPERSPLQVQVTGKIDQPQYTIEKIAFQSVPGFYVTANLYIPKGADRPLPAVIYVCGHNGGKALYQHHGITLAKNGYVAFVLDPIQNSEVFSVHAGIRGNEMIDWYSRGYTPAGVEAWNAMRAIDYLETRPEVDRTRIGMTGFSGGAYMTFYTAAVDPRIKAAAPFMGISTYSANIRLDLQQVHCDCMYPINSKLQDLMHLGALIAPRPLLVGEGKRDFSFPELGYNRFRKEMGSLYSDYQAADRFDLIEIDAEHEDSNYFREQAIHWFDRHLLGIPERKVDLTYEALPDKMLAVYPDGPPADAKNDRVHETFVPRARLKNYATLPAWESRRAELLAELRSNVLARVPNPVGEIKITEASDPAVIPKWFHRDVRLSSTATPPIRAFLRDSRTPDELRPGVVYIASDGDDARYLHLILWGLTVPNTWPAVIVFPRGVGEITGNRSLQNETLRSAMVIGETTDSMRVSDVLVGLEALLKQKGVDPSRVTVVGKGVSGALGIYAAILDERIREVVVEDPPVTHERAPIFLNVLRYTDLPEAAALIAPRRLSFYQRIPGEFDYTRRIYELYGKPGEFVNISKVDR